MRRERSLTVCASAARFADPDSWPQRAADLHGRLGAISVPTLAIADDPATPPEMVRLISDGVRDGRFVLIRDAAHLVNAERPDQVTAAFAEHLERADGNASAR